jgi:UDP:flavonoid glycosyltransferase YjiC (YdhE family)
MKIIIPTIGTRGDVQPYIALGLSDADMRRAAVDLGAVMRAEPDGVAQVVQLIERTCGRVAE